MLAATATTHHTPIIPVQRGKRLYEQLLFDDNIVALPKKEHNGRDPHLIQLRDNFLLHRFYFYSKIKRKIYGDTLKELAKETWLSELQVQKIIQSKTALVMDIKKTAPTVKLLKQQWQYVVWD